MWYLRSLFGTFELQQALLECLLLFTIPLENNDPISYLDASAFYAIFSPTSPLSFTHLQRLVGAIAASRRIPSTTSAVCCRTGGSRLRGLLVRIHRRSWCTTSQPTVLLPLAYT